MHTRYQVQNKIAATVNEIRRSYADSDYVVRTVWLRVFEALRDKDDLGEIEDVIESCKRTIDDYRFELRKANTSVYGTLTRVYEQLDSIQEQVESIQE